MAKSQKKEYLICEGAPEDTERVHFHEELTTACSARGRPSAAQASYSVLRKPLLLVHCMQPLAYNVG